MYQILYYITEHTWSIMKLTRKGRPTANVTPMMAPVRPVIPQKTGLRPILHKFGIALSLSKINKVMPRLVFELME